LKNKTLKSTVIEFYIVTRPVLLSRSDILTVTEIKEMKVWR